MKKSLKTTLICIGAAIALVIAMASLVGIYIVNPIPTVPDGELIVYFNRGTGLPAISSADGLNLAAGTAVNAQSRAETNARVAAIIQSKVAFKLAYSKGLYLYSTGNRDFSDLGAPPPKARP